MRSLSRLLASAILCGGLVAALSIPIGGVPPIGSLIEPWDGLYRTARQANHRMRETAALEGLDTEVVVYRDQRGVPHIFAASDRDAIVALGYVTASDRLFQMDFVPRVASGRLAEVLGPDAVRTDRFMRSIGMELGAARNADRIARSGGVENDIATWYCDGVNAYVDTLEKKDLPLEFRLLGYEPDRCSTLQVARVLQFMSYDLTFRTDDARYARLQAALDPLDYDELYPLHATINDPIIPFEPGKAGGISKGVSGGGFASAALEYLAAEHDAVRERSGFGFEHGKGSNNWAVSGSRSTTGSVVVAGDMHLRVSLPAIWYEVHLVTPSMNVYGVSIPGAPLPIEAFNDSVAWAFTNTGSDQIDHIALTLDESRSGYLVDEQVRPFRLVADTLWIRSAGFVVDTLHYSDWGPVIFRDEAALALRWVAHDTSRTLRAVWEMLHAKNLDAFEAGLRFWDSPMQNVLYGDVDGNIAIRSAGYLPIRRDGHGRGVLDGSRGGPIWIGRVPFEELPYARNPAQGYLASANQQPAAPSYPHYLGHDWRRSYRGIRINQLLRAKARHSVEDLMRYQADVVAVQGRDFVDLLRSVRCESPQAEEARGRLVAWNGSTAVDDTVTVLFDVWLSKLQELAWDEEELAPLRPYTAQLFGLLTGSVSASWANRVQTVETEGAEDLVCAALTGADAESHRASRWGDHHGIVFEHLLRTDRLGELSRGPYPYPGYAETLSPGRGRRVTHSASWRVVVDLSTRPPTGYGVYPGGASGNPLSDLYDSHLEAYLSFDHFRLQNSPDTARFEQRRSSAKLNLFPTGR